jgi:hypothetical protein
MSTFWTILFVVGNYFIHLPCPLYFLYERFWALELGLVWLLAPILVFLKLGLLVLTLAPLPTELLATYISPFARFSLLASVK